MIATFFALAALLSVVPSPLAPAPGSLAATITERPDQDGKISIALRNDGPQTVIAWRLQVREINRDGSSSTSLVARDTNRAHVLRKLGVMGQGVPQATILDPGETITVHAFVSPAAVDAQATVLAVIFDDGRAEGDKESIAVLLRQRERVAAAAERWLPSLERASAPGEVAGKTATLRQARQAAVSSDTDDEIPGLIDQLLNQSARAPQSFQSQAAFLVRYLQALRDESRLHQQK